MISMTGYYLSVIRCAVEQLENEFADSINSEKEGNGNRINGFHKWVFDFCELVKLMKVGRVWVIYSFKGLYRCEIGS